MTYAADRLFNEVIRNKMGVLASRIKVQIIISFLPCLTITDREEIEAKRENSGNYCAVMLLLDNLRRRENWPEQFIKALREIEQPELANLISDAYNRIRGLQTAPATAPVVAPPIPAHCSAEHSATVAAAAAAPILVPPSSEPSATVVAAAAVSAPAPAAASPIQPHCSVEHSATVAAAAAAATIPVPPPSEPSATVVGAAAVSAPPIPAPSSAEPSATVTTATIHKTPCSTLPLLTPSVQTPAQSFTSSQINSTRNPHPSKAVAESTDRHAEVSAQNASVNNPKFTQPIEPVLSVITSDTRTHSPVIVPTLTPSLRQFEVSVESSETHTPAALSGPSSIEPTVPTNPTSNKVNKPANTSQSTALPQKGPVAASISVKHPIQDTNPPGTGLVMDSQNNTTINPVGERVNTSFLPNCQNQETSRRTVQAPLLPSPCAVAGSPFNVAAEREEYFSKPGVLREDEPCISEHSLQISNVAEPIQSASPQTVPNTGEEPANGHVLVDHSLLSSSSTIVQSENVGCVRNSTPGVFENGFSEEFNSSYLHQPVEDHYESLANRHVVQFSENPSFLNFSGQPLSTVRQTTIDSRSAAESPVDIPQSEPGECVQSVLQQVQSNSRLIAAAAFGITAVFVALKLRH